MLKPWSEIKVGDLLKLKNSMRRVLEVGASGRTILVSYILENEDEEHGACGWYTVKEVEKVGWALHGEPEKWEPEKWEPEKWEPEVDQEYWYIHHTGVWEDQWDNDCIDKKRRDNLGIYPTREAAQAMFEKLKKVVRGEE